MRVCWFPDVDECMEFSPCLNNGACVNTVGSYYCRCEMGWTGQNCGTGRLLIGALRHFAVVRPQT